MLCYYFFKFHHTNRDNNKRMKKEKNIKTWQDKTKMIPPSYQTSVSGFKSIFKFSLVGVLRGYFCSLCSQ